MRPNALLWSVVLSGLLIPARASLIFDLTSAAVSGTSGDNVSFEGTLTNTGSADLFLNGDVSFLPYAELMVDDSPFFTNVPAFLAPGDSYAGPLWNVIISPQASPGMYFGSFTVQGGSDVNTFNDLGTQDFEVVVPATIPEPACVILFGTGLLGVILMRLWIRVASG